MLTKNDIDDAQVVAPLPEGATVQIKSFRGDGAYDKSKVRKLLTTQEIEQIHTSAKQFCPPKVVNPLWLADLQ